MGIKIGITKVVEVEAKTLRIHCKIRDEFSGYILDQDNKKIGGQDDGYVPEFLPEGGGDYLALDVDLSSGQITNWNKPTAEQITQFINKEE